MSPCSDSAVSVHPGGCRVALGVRGTACSLMPRCSWQSEHLGDAGSVARLGARFDARLALLGDRDEEGPAGDRHRDLAKLTPYRLFGFLALGAHDARYVDRIEVHVGGGGPKDDGQEASPLRRIRQVHHRQAPGYRLLTAEQGSSASLIQPVMLVRICRTTSVPALKGVGSRAPAHAALSYASPPPLRLGALASVVA